MSIRLGFYVCHCGLNIAGKVRVEEVAAFARELKNVVIARDYKFMCSDPGQEMIEKDIREFDLNRVVVASCSPRFHEKTFQSACRRAGLNPYFFQMASVREQVSWVTEDEDEATRKAKTLVAGAINRVNYHESLDAREAIVHPDIMVVGGGIAGMQAALDIGNGGHKVYLVEKSTTIGGHMLQFDKTFPTLDCAACIGTPKMVEVAQNPNIELLSYSEVTEVSGFIGSYTVRIRRKPRYVKEGVCTGCGECANVCPVSVPSEWDEGLGNRAAIYREFPQAVPITFCIDKKDRAPCVIACPNHVNAHGYVAMIAQEKYQEALEIITRTLPLPGVIGRICPHPCEEACRRKEVDEPISICSLKRFAADKFNINELPLPDITPRDEKVAIIGAGPAGLTAAYFLAKDGFPVTIFEALPVAGGMLRVGIPDYRLPPDVLEKEIKWVTRLGVEIKFNTALGRDITIDGLMDDGYKSVYLAIGCHADMKLNIPNEDAKGVIPGVKFLRDSALYDIKKLEGRVVIIGGGDVAIDAARSALRLGADKVSILYRRTQTEMPARNEEIEDGLEEGVDIQFLMAPVEVVEKEGRTVGLKCIKMELGDPDASGRRRPVPVKGSEFVVDTDIIIPAIGQRTDTSFLESATGVELDKWHNIQVDPLTFETTRKGVFAGGDAQTGPSIAINAVAAGREAAISISRYLNAEDLKEGREPLEVPQENFNPFSKDIEKVKRSRMPRISMEERKKSFTEVELGLSENQAVIEAEKCLNCMVCCECMECVRVCEAKAIDHSMKEEELEVKVGSIIIATGYDTMDPTPMKQFGYGKYPNVFTSLEFERLSNATGPTGGEILIRDENRELTRIPKSVAILHCIGSRDVNYHEYCSRVCCMYALKYAHLIHEKVGHDAQIFNFYIDMRCFGKGYEEFYERCQQEGTNFIRGKVAEITDQAIKPEEEGKLIAIAEDTLLGRSIRVPVDMVILCNAIQARSDALEVGRIFGVNLGADGFFLEEHPKLGPLDTATDGVFLAGVCQGPKDIPDSVCQASGAAVKALALATLGKVDIAPIVSWIDPDVCAGCQTCIDLCPYSAIEYNARMGISVVNEALCKGCGSCAGFCPSGAAQVKHFNQKQLFAELEGIIDSLHSVGM